LKIVALLLELCLCEAFGGQSVNLPLGGALHRGFVEDEKALHDARQAQTEERGEKDDHEQGQEHESILQDDQGCREVKEVWGRCGAVPGALHKQDVANNEPAKGEEANQAAELLERHNPGERALDIALQDPGERDRKREAGGFDEAPPAKWGRTAHLLVPVHEQEDKGGDDGRGEDEGNDAELLFPVVESVSLARRRRRRRVRVAPGRPNRVVGRRERQAARAKGHSRFFYREPLAAEPGVAAMVLVMRRLVRRLVRLQLTGLVLVELLQLQKELLLPLLRV